MCEESKQSFANVFYTEIKLSFGVVSLQVEEGDTVQVCIRLGGTSWMLLERNLTVVLDSDGGT